MNYSKALLLILISIACLITSSCSVVSKAMLPYNEEPLCKRGTNTGYCGGITEVNERIEQDLQNRR